MDDSAGHLLHLVRTGRAQTRSELRGQTGLSRTAVVARVNRLLDAGLLRLGADHASTGGRPPGALLLNPDAGTVLAVAVGRSRSQVAVFDLAGVERGVHSVDHEVGAGPDVVMPRVAGELGALLTGRVAPVLAVGVSLPGTVDPVRGVSLESPVMAAWDGVDLAPFVSGLTGAPLVVANDADVLARSEQHAHGAAFDDLLVLKASTGLGLGIVAGGRVVAGHLGGAGEIGHTQVDAAAGRPCRCGDTGCLETLAGGWALVARLAEQGRAVSHVRDLVALATGGDAEARRALREAGRRLGEVLAVAVNLLNPQAVVIGGDMAAAFDVYAAGVRESVYARSSALATRDLQFLPSTHGDRAGLVGCAALALDRALDEAAVEALVHERTHPAAVGARPAREPQPASGVAAVQ